MSKNSCLEATRRPAGILLTGVWAWGGQSFQSLETVVISLLSAPCLSCSANTQLALLPLVSFCSGHSSSHTTTGLGCPRRAHPTGAYWNDTRSRQWAPGGTC